MKLKSPKKQVNKYNSLTLNSYKIDTSTLQERARQLQQLKSELTTQISQYKINQNSINEEIRELKSQNWELKSTIKQLRLQLQNINKTSYKANQQKIQSLSKQLQRYKNQSRVLKAEVQQMRQYKKMYEIEVQNKNNITKFYQNKLDSFKKDKTKLVQKYQEKISILSSGFAANNSLNTLDNKLYSTANFDKHKNSTNLQKQTNRQLQESQTSAKPIKIIKTTAKSSSNSNLNDIHKTPQSSKNKPQDFIFQTPKIECKTTQNININQLPIDSNTSIQYRTTTSPQIKLNTSTSEDIFLDLVESIFVNLNELDLKSDQARLEPQIKRFSQVLCPTRSQIYKLFTINPFKSDLPRQKIERCIERIQKYLKLKYNSCSGRLIVQLILDKIQDYQIAYEVNQDQIQVSGLSMTQTDNESEYLSFGKGNNRSSTVSNDFKSSPMIRKRVSIQSSSRFGNSKVKL